MDDHLKDKREKGIKNPAYPSGTKSASQDDKFVGDCLDLNASICVTQFSMR